MFSLPVVSNIRLKPCRQKKPKPKLPAKIKILRYYVLIFISTSYLDIRRNALAKSILKSVHYQKKQKKKTIEFFIFERTYFSLSKNVLYWNDELEKNVCIEEIIEMKLLYRQVLVIPQVQCRGKESQKWSSSEVCQLKTILNIENTFNLKRYSINLKENVVCQLKTIVNILIIAKSFKFELKINEINFKFSFNRKLLTVK